VRRDTVDAHSVVQVGLEDLYTLLRDDRTSNPSDEFLALAAEHDSGDDFDPTGTRAVQHDSLVLVGRGT
jgi:hypothetical protein